MESHDLPVGLAVRPPRLADVARIYALVAAYGNAVVGFPDFTPDDVRDELNEPGFAADTDGWLVQDAGGDVLGYATARRRRPDGDQVGIDVVSLDEQVAAWLLDASFERARAMAHESGHERAIVDHGTYRRDEQLGALLADRGFRVATSFYRMRVDRSDVEPNPLLPTGVTVPASDDVSVRRAAHGVREESFVEHFGEEPESYDDWVAALESRSTFGWSQVRLAELDGEPVGMIRVSEQFVEDEHCGYVAQVGVVPRARGRGIAKALLKQAFAADAARGLAGTLLHVDSNNTTPALGLYESVGMRTILVIDAWRAEVAARDS
ncbi:GNAT family N-acetyltransferase [Nocardioidaceae bacterium SCSIO 66511]|nr:GNAT family N-acetyltransferase [Nocardioidaceae bacterium SCSIO 66511]